MRPRQKISVILIAYNRKEFLGKALSSVLHQTLEQSYYEVIVITNFDFEIPPDSENVVLLRMDGSIGEFVSYGIRVAKGDIICLLEDDDIFFSQKLERVLEVFGNEKICYYKNSMVTFSQKDQSNLEFNGFNQYHLLLNFEPRTIRSTRDMRSFPSTISFLRASILPKLDNMKYVSSEIGAYLYYVLIETGCRMVTDKTILTGYRVGHTSDSTANKLEEYFNVRKKYLNRSINTYDILLKDLSLQYLRKIVDCERSFYESQLYYISGKRPAFSDLINSLRYMRISTNFLIRAVGREIVSLLIFVFGPKLFKILIRIQIRLRNYG